VAGFLRITARVSLDLNMLLSLILEFVNGLCAAGIDFNIEEYILGNKFQDRRQIRFLCKKSSENYANFCPIRLRKALI